MLRVQRIKGLNISHSVAPVKTSFDEAELAAASVPGWKMLISPGADYFDASNGDILNRVTPLKSMSPRSSDNQYQAVQGYFSNNVLANAFPEEGITSIYDVGVEVNPTAWTVLMVVECSENGPHEVFTPFPEDVEDVEDESSCALRVGFNTTNIFRIWKGNTTARLAHGDASLYQSQVVYCMATFSTTDGLRMFRNGVEVAASSGDLAALTATRFTMFGSTANDTSSSGLNGKFGEIGLLDISLGDPQNESYRNAIDTWLMNKYGIQ